MKDIQEFEREELGMLIMGLIEVLLTVVAGIVLYYLNKEIHGTKIAIAPERLRFASLLHGKYYYERKIKVLGIVWTALTAAFLVLIIVCWDSLIFFKMLLFGLFMLFLYFANKKGEKLFFISFFTFLILFVVIAIQGTAVYIANIQQIGYTLFSSTPIKIFPYNEGISVIQTKDTFEYSTITEENKLISVPIPKGSTDVFLVEKIEDISLLKIIETRNMMNYNVSPAIPVDPVVTIRYVLHIPQSTYGVQ
jgi:hypothetical protein